MTAAVARTIATTGAAKRASKNGDKFGSGQIEGIQATEAANSAVVGSNLIPTIALGIPGNVAAAVIRGLSWVFTAAIRASDALANYVGHASEFEADQRVVRMGFGRELAGALRQVMATRSTRRPKGWRGRLSASHPPARTRVARIEALLRHPAR